ncbi:RNA polymerase sigma-70 factor [Arachidicoccus ginsenosidivorans]|uniref:RNA polymerase sigma-70 factor n=1 Tax=Arachidicoccus ginsenosidivorans TaxID=496057 RepID=A0A5B8VH04_9BACT|nr:RNA polymerase sigma-70 factor [Arachidicoccus ginsenosidivorans]QEC70371.1 RNA polymerase sigma-70 factor [Arachidicoccus ginsenosidivorans]
MDFTYSKYDDEKLSKMMCQGDLDAFAALFNRYHEPLFDFAFKLIQDKEEAADIIQDIFMSLWNRRFELEFSHSIKAWLYQAVRFRAAKYIHHLQRKREILGELIQYLPQIEHNSPATSLEHHQLDNSIKNAIEGMPARMKEVFVLSREQQLSHREIGLKLNIAESTVKKTVQNALRFIREKSIIDLVLVLILSKIF